MFALVVDDERSVRDALSHALRSEGYDVPAPTTTSSNLSYSKSSRPGSEPCSDDRRRLSRLVGVESAPTAVSPWIR